MGTGPARVRPPASPTTAAAPEGRATEEVPSVGGSLKTGRWVRYSEPQSYANLLLSLLHRLGIDANGFVSSTGPLPGLDRTLGTAGIVTDDETWRVTSKTDSRLTARGLLHASEKIEESSIDDVRLSNGERLKIQARFRNLDEGRLDDFCGRVVTIVGTYWRRDGHPRDEQRSTMTV